MNRNMKRINKLPLRDPLSVLPVEVFCHLLSSLDPASIAHASATQTSWRDVILLDSTLFDEIDLTRLNTEGIATCLSIIQHLKALISRANERVVKGSFDLTPFRCVLRGQVGPGMMHCSHLLPSFQEALQPLHATLKDITLEIRQPKEYKEGVGADSFDIIQPLLEQFHKFDQLKKVFISSPCSMELKTGREGTSGKSFTMASNEDYSTRLEDDRSATKILAILKEVDRCTDAASFTEFSSTGGFDISGPINETISSILDLLEDSKNSFQKLDLSYFGRVRCSETWNLAMGCTHAESISIDLDPGLVENEEELLILPVGGPPFNHLVDFDFGSRFRRVPWNLLTKKIGTNLECLRLKGAIGGSFISWDSLGSLFINIQHTLRRLYLSWGNLEGEEDGISEAFGHPSKDFFNFPRLGTLDFGGIPSQSAWFFADLKAPMLRRLTLESNDEGGNSGALKLLVNLLGSTAETLAYLDIYIKGAVKASLQELPQDVTFSLPNLESMTINYGFSAPVGLCEWLSRLNCPELTDLSVSEQFWSDFQKNSPKLGDFEK